MVVVDPHRAVAQTTGHAVGRSGIRGPHRSGQAVLRVIGGLDGLGLGGERLDRDDGAEALLDHRGVLPIALVQHGRGVEVPVLMLLAAPVAADPQAGAGLDAALDVVGDLVPVLLGDQRAGLGLLVERTAHDDVAGAADDLVDEALRDRVLHDQARACRADQPGVRECGIEGVVHGGVEVGIGEHDIGVLAAQLQGDLLHAVGRRLGDPPAGDEASGEGDEVDLRVARQRGTDDCAVAEDQVRDSGGQPQLVEHIHDQDRRVRGQLGRLEHEGVAGRQRGGDLPRCLKQGEVPGGDHAADAHGLVDHPRDDGVVARIHQTARALVRDLAEVAEAGRDVVHVALGLDQALAGVEGLGTGELVFALEQGVRDADQEVAALSGGSVHPGAGLERLAGGEDGALDILSGGLGDDADLGAVGGADDGAGPAVGGGDPLSVDVQGRAGLSHGAPSGLRCSRSRRRNLAEGRRWGSDRCRPRSQGWFRPPRLWRSRRRRR